MKEKSEPIISFHDANIINGENTVVYGLNMDVSGGQTVYILGKVGTGKTSIIRTITAENRLGGGEGIVCGFNLGTLKQKDIPFLRRKIGVVFQDFQLLMDRSIHDNLSFVLKATGWKDGQQMEKRIEEALKSVDMQTKSHKMPHQLSGGEQQRIARARALLNAPEVIVADEPTGNLDTKSGRIVIDELCRINEEMGKTIAMVTHDAYMASRCKRVILLKDGNIMEDLVKDCTREEFYKRIQSEMERLYDR